MNKGVLHALLAYLLWGLLPVFWKQLLTVPSFQVIAHRVVWSFLTLLILIALQRKRLAIVPQLNGRILKIYLAAGLLIGNNWFLYVWAVNSGHIVETSLGYFINPLLNVVFGVLFFKEKLRRWQWVSVCLAASGVVYLCVGLGAPPWIALSLATSFAIYGVIKKMAPLPPVEGLLLETSVLLLPSFGYLGWCVANESSAFLHQTWTTDALLIAGGVATTLPLLLFASAARSISLSLIGILQFIAPTLQFLCGVGLYGEPFSMRQSIGYVLVWLGLVVFATDGFRQYRQSTAMAKPRE